MKNPYSVGTPITEARWTCFIACLESQWKDWIGVTATNTVGNSKLPQVESEIAENLYDPVVMKSFRLNGIKFIGKLYIAKILSQTIIHEGIKHMLTVLATQGLKGQEDTIDDLIALLSTTGWLLDIRSADEMNTYFAQMKDLSSRDLGKEAGMIKVGILMISVISPVKSACVSDIDHSAGKAMGVLQPSAHSIPAFQLIYMPTDAWYLGVHEARA